MTVIFLPGEPKPAKGAARARAEVWRGELLRLDVVTPDEPLELVSRPGAATSGRVVVVVRDQLEQLNDLYCRAVLDLETYRSFEPFLDKALASPVHDLGRQVGRVLDAPTADAVVIPASRLTQGWPEGQPLPGPVLMSAIRVFHKRLTRMSLVKRRTASAIVKATTDLRMRAAEQAWDDESFWGWPAARAAEVAEHFRAGNEAFAQRVWGSAWPEPSPVHEQSSIDLASKPPRIVADVMTSIQQAIQAVRRTA